MAKARNLENSHMCVTCQVPLICVTNPGQRVIVRLLLLGCRGLVGSTSLGKSLFLFNIRFTKGKEGL